MWNSRELSRLEGVHWHRESGAAKEADETAQGKCKGYEEKGQSPAGPHTAEAERGGVATEVTANQERAESLKPEERGSKIRGVWCPTPQGSRENSALKSSTPEVLA